MQVTFHTTDGLTDYLTSRQEVHGGVVPVEMWYTIVLYRGTHKNVSSDRPANVPSAIDVTSRLLSRSLKTEQSKVATAEHRTHTPMVSTEHQLGMRQKRTVLLNPCIQMQRLQDPLYPPLWGTAYVVTDASLG